MNHRELMKCIASLLPCTAAEFHAVQRGPGGKAKAQEHCLLTQRSSLCLSYTHAAPIQCDDSEILRYPCCEESLCCLPFSVRSR